MKSYQTIPNLVEKQRKDFYSSYPHGRGLSEVQMFPLDKIRPNLGDYEDSRVSEYEELIYFDTPMPPIVIRLYPNEKKYTIRDGTHRDLASRRCGMTHIPVLVEEPPMSFK